MNKILFALSLVFLSLATTLSAQEEKETTASQEMETAVSDTTPVMADAMRENGKIYVVVAMILIVLAGLFIYLFLVDKKVKKLENLIREKQAQTK